MTLATMHRIFGDPRVFMDQLLQALASVGIDVSILPMDHLCYRVATQDRYDLLKVELARVGRLLHEAQIGGRPIATFKLSEPIHHRGRVVDVIELPAPKPGRSYTEGWEHAEFVIAESFDAFAARYPHIAFDTSGANKAHNPELRVELGPISAKFHHASLEDVIAVELAAQLS